MSYLWLAGLGEDYGDYIEAEGSVVDFVCGEKIASGSYKFSFLRGGDDRFGRSERFIGAGLDLNENDCAISVDHNAVDFAGFAGEVACEGF